jgi:pimeloyl-ACP methyl ester carboxylesterase
VPKAKINDINIYYDVHGDGFPLVMVMGFLGNADCWDPRMLPALSDKFKVIMFDNRGAGRTDVSDKEFSIKLLAEDTVGLMDVLNVPKAHVLGTSMGGMIAQELALNYPGRVEKLILTATFCGGPHSILIDVADLNRTSNLLKKLADRPRLRGLAEMVINKLTLASEYQESRSVPAPAKAVGVLVDIAQDLVEKGSWDKQTARKLLPIVCTEEFLQANPEVAEMAVGLILEAPTQIEGFLNQQKAIMEFDTCERLPQVKSQTLVLAGKRDVFIPPENAQILADGIPRSKLVYLENSGHMFIEEADEVTKIILEFLS